MRTRRKNIGSIILLAVAVSLLYYSGLWRQLFASPDHTSRCLAQAQDEQVRDLLSSTDGKGVWYTQDRSDTVLVFVHGILSDNVNAWCFVEESKPDRDRYWPQIIKGDRRFADISIFLAGYPAGPAIGDYGIDWIAKTLYTELRTPGLNDDFTVLDSDNLVFVAHSAGGIAVRKMLMDFEEDFIDKNIGLVLMASPSLGSQDADVMERLINFWNFELGQQLQWQGEYLLKIDTDFNALLSQHTFHRLVGAEAVENYAPWIGPLRRQIVEPSSGARYFKHQRMIPETDHMSIIKPSGLSHLSHTFLVEFYVEEYLRRDEALVGRERADRG